MEGKYEQLSFFEEEKKEKEKEERKKKTVPVAKGVIREFSELTSDELFDGYRTMKATTFSGGLKFIDEICQKFEKVELVFGSDKVLPVNAKTLISVQKKLLSSELLNRIKYPRLVEMAESGALTIYVMNGMASHAKTYLLSGDGEKRIITGSCNFSKSAFSGKQLENISVFDSADDPDFDSKYGWYESFFERLKVGAGTVDGTSVKAYLKNPGFFDDHPEKLPVKVYLDKNSFLDLDVEYNADENAESAGLLNGVFSAPSEEALEYLRKARRENESHITNTIFARTVKLIKKSSARRRMAMAKTVESEVPHLRVNPELGAVSYDNVDVDLDALSEERIGKDAEIIGWYFRSLYAAWLVTSAQEDADYTLVQFWRFLVWSFVSVFFPYLRYCEYQRYPTPSYSYPVFALLNGKSGSGKTRFAEFIAKMMSGIHVSVVKGEYFTKTNVNGQRFDHDGVVITYDEVNKKKFEDSSGELIKNNSFGLNDDVKNRLTYPCVCVLSNKIDSISHDIARRTIRFYSKASMTFDEGVKHEPEVDRATENVTNDLFLEFVKEMFPHVQKITDCLVGESPDGNKPDIFLAASTVLLGILRKYCAILPDQISTFDTSDCMGDAAQGDVAVDRLLRDFQANPNCFSVSRAQNLVTFTPPENYRKSMANTYPDLPKKFQPCFTSGAMTFNLAVAQESGFDFSRQFEKERQKTIRHLIELHEGFPHFFEYSDGYVTVREDLTKSVLEEDYGCLEDVADIAIEDGSLKIAESDFASLTGIRRKRKFALFRKRG